MSTPASTPGAAAPPVAGIDAVVFDWGGVLTPPMTSSFDAWLAADGIDGEHWGAVMRSWLLPDDDRAAILPDGTRARPASPVHALERGELEPAEFELLLVEALAEQGTRAEADGLLSRMLAPLASLDTDMMDLVREVRSRGGRTALLSNSWGDHYPRELFDGLFDAVVISGRVGMRKPEPEIFRHVAEQVGVPPGRCLLVDDLPQNIAGAQAVGMAALLHTDHPITRGAVLGALAPGRSLR